MRYLAVVLLALVGAVPIAAAPVPDRVRPAVDDEQRTPTADRIRLGDGFLGRRFAVNEKNLLTADEEWMLAGFRHRPGEQAWVGEHVGKFLHAATLAWAISHDARLRAKLDRIVTELLKTQEEDGYLGTYVPSKRFQLARDNDWDVWVHKYDLIGLLTYYQYTGEVRALDACRRIGDLLSATFGKDKKDILSAGTHVGMAATSVLEPMVRLYALTGERKYLAFCRYLTEAMEEPRGPKLISTLTTVKEVNRTANGKAYEMMSNLIGLCELYRMTGDRRLLTPVLNAWDDIVARRLYLTGTASWGEHFQPDHKLPNEGPVGETCVTVTWMQLNLQLLRLTGEARYAEEIERSALNHLAAAQRVEAYGWCYFTELSGAREFGGRTCCASSGPRGLAVLPTCVLTTDDAGIVVNLYESCDARLTLKDGTTTRVRMDSRYPTEDKITITVQPEKPRRFVIKLRIPTWCTGACVTVNGVPGRGEAKAGSYLALHAREWKDGDTIELQLPLSLRMLEDPQANANKVALAYGPLVLATDEHLIDHSLPAAGKGSSNIVLTSTDPAALELKRIQLTDRSTWSGVMRYEITAHHGTSDRPGDAFRLRLLPFAQAGSLPWSEKGPHPRVLVWFDRAATGK
jgi:DUF1680 family protein